MAYTQIPAFLKITDIQSETEFVIVFQGKEYLIKFKDLLYKLSNNQQLSELIQQEIELINSEIEDINLEILELKENQNRILIPLKITDETPTQNGIYLPVEDGLYPNGLVKNSENGFEIFVLYNGEWKKETYPISVTASGDVKLGDIRPVSGDTVEKYAIKKINTVSELRTNFGDYEGQIITLLGYYEAGDKEPLNYKWSSEQGVDDGGSVINTDNGSWLAVFNEVLNIRDFGSKCDGINDDSSFFQNCVNYAASVGFKKINTPSNSICLIGSTVNLFSDLEIELNNSKLKGVSKNDVGRYTTCIFKAVEKNNITISKGVLDGDCPDTGYVGTTDYNKVSNLLYFEKCDNIKLKDIELTKFISNTIPSDSSFYRSGIWSCLFIKECIDVNLIDCKLNNSAIEGVFFWECRNVIVNNFNSENKRMSTPISFWFCDGVKLLNSTIIEDVDRGVNAGSTVNLYSKNVTIDGNYISGGTSFDIGCEIEMDNTYIQENVTISNNHFKTCINAIYDEKEYHKNKNINIFNNVIDASDDYGSPYNYGIRLGNAIDSSIHNNTIIGADNAIRNFGDDWENVNIYDNVIKDVSVSFFISVFGNDIENLNVFRNKSTNRGLQNTTGGSDSFFIFQNSSTTTGNEQVNNINISNNTAYSSTSWFWNRNAGFTTFFISNLTIDNNIFHDINDVGCFRAITLSYIKQAVVKNNLMFNVGVNGCRVSYSEDVDIFNNNVQILNGNPPDYMFRIYDTNTGFFKFINNKSNTVNYILSGYSGVNYSNIDIRFNQPSSYSLIKSSDKGTTANIPTYNLEIGRIYYDETLNRPVFWNGTLWVDGYTKSSNVLDVSSPQATDLATALTLVNELKAKLNAKLQADRDSGQQAI